eukprot:m.4162 g.4162  ORF g.4162 m.4162 type:complete len:215 (+) comp3831_c0_seq1:346-990(+)
MSVVETGVACFSFFVTLPSSPSARLLFVDADEFFLSFFLLLELLVFTPFIAFVVLDFLGLFYFCLFRQTTSSLFQPQGQCAVCSVLVPTRLNQQSTNMEDQQQKQGYEGGENHQIRITLTSSNPKKLESACAKIITNTKERGLSVKGPVRLPTKQLKITTRKTPNGEGSKTWDRYIMRIHKRLIDMVADSDSVKKITSLSIEPEVTVEVTVAAA